MSTPPVLGLPAPLAAVARQRCLVMGIVNVTPDSFSDGGRYLDPGAAVAHGCALLAEGADLIDVGGESTRPGAKRVPEVEERRRVLPVIRALVSEGAVVSVDTMRANVAAAALDAGAHLVNDVSGGLADPGLLEVVKAAEVPYVLTHWRGHSTAMQDKTGYVDVVADVCRELLARLEAVTAAGVDPERVVLDPGLGFAKTAEHNWALLAHLEALVALGRPVLVGASRKSFLGPLLAAPGEPPVAPAGRDRATAAVTAIAAAAGAWCVRVHDVGPSRDAVRVAAAVVGAR